MPNQLHTPQELTDISNAAHVAEGILLIIFAVILVLQGFGYLQKTWQKYLIPGMALLASLMLVGFLFFDHVNELPAAWQWITTDMQQQQHLWISVILGVTSILALIGVRLNRKWLQAALPLGFGAIGIVFLIHPQHGTDAEAAKALLIHRVAGTSLVVAGLTHIAGLFMAQWRKVMAVITAVALILSGVLFISYREPLMASDSMEGMDMGNMTVQSHRTYSLNLTSGQTYQPTQPTKLTFDIRDENNKVLKDFDTVHEKQMHLIVVRKDRTNFQHVHPVFDAATGTFTMDGFAFPTDGAYRVFADFTASDAQKDTMGMKLPSTPYKDVTVGDMAKYTPVPLDSDKLMSETDGLMAEITPPPSDDGPSSLTYNAGTGGVVSIDIKKNDQPYKQLENYLGALGHLVALGPNLEFVHAHPLSEDVNNQYGFVMFNINFPEAGRYKLYLQTQTNSKVSTFDFALSVQKPLDTGAADNPPTMNHSGH